MEQVKEKNILINEITNSNISFLIENLTIEQLIDISIDSNSDHQLAQEAKEELIKRGKDNIQDRINIKKQCKNSLTSLESLIYTISNGNSNKEVAKSIKTKFLTSISILDKLQLEWQKYDLRIKG